MHLVSGIRHLTNNPTVVPDTVTPIVNKIQELPDEVPRVGQRDPEKRRWEGSHSDFLAWSVAKAIESTRGADELGEVVDKELVEAAENFIEAFKESECEPSHLRFSGSLCPTRG